MIAVVSADLASAGIVVFHQAPTEGVLAHGAKRGAKRKKAWHSCSEAQHERGIGLAAHLPNESCWTMLMLQGKAVDSAAGTAAWDFIRLAIRFARSNSFAGLSRSTGADIDRKQISRVLVAGQKPIGCPGKKCFPLALAGH